MTLTSIVVGVVYWLIWCGLVAWIGAEKGRSAGNWFFLSVVLSPIVALVAVLIVKPAESVDMELARKNGTAGRYRICRECAEVVRVEAVKCRYCGVALDAVQPSPAWRPASIPDRLGFPPSP